MTELLLIVILLIGPGWQIVVQPQACPLCVTMDAGAGSQFTRAAEIGVIGILAHNDLAGAKFYELKPGSRMTVVLIDGARRDYIVTGIGIYYRSHGLLCQAWQCYSEDQVFAREYVGGLTLQTCIGDNEGFYFVHAAPGAPAIPARWSITNLVNMH